MTTAETLAKALCSTFCEAITVNPVPCGFAVSASFTDASGDRIAFYVVVTEGDGYRLEDDGEYLARLVALGIDIEKGQRQQLLESVLQRAGAFWDRDTYEIKTGGFESKELTARMVQFLSALIRVRDQFKVVQSTVDAELRDWWREELARVRARRGRARERAHEENAEQMTGINKTFPWKFEHEDGWVRGNDGRLVALISVAQFDRQFEVGPLIAAAPDLEAALRELVARIEEEQGFHKNYDLVPELTGARAALAKAGGTEDDNDGPPR